MPYGGQLWFPGGGGTQQPTRNIQTGGPNTLFSGAPQVSGGWTPSGSASPGGIGGYSRSNPPPAWPGASPIYDAQGNFQGYGSSTSLGPPGGPGLGTPLHPAATPTGSGGVSRGPGGDFNTNPYYNPATGSYQSQPTYGSYQSQGSSAPNIMSPSGPAAGSSQPQTGPGSWMQRILTLMGGPQGSWGSQFPYMSQDSNFSYDPYY